MIAFAAIFLALTACAVAQTSVPPGYRAVYFTSMVNAQYVIVPMAPSSDAAIVVQMANKTAAQQWYIKDSPTAIQLASTSLCLDAGPASNWRDLGSLSLKPCADAADAQTWNIQSDGRIALVASNPQECLDLEFLRATPNNPVVLFSCAGLGNTGAADTGINWPVANANATTS